MKNVKYIGSADRLSISKKDFKEAGLESKDVTWNGHGDVQEVADEAADHLLAERKRFTEVSDAEADQN